MNQPIRILHVVTYMGRGGLETMLMNYYRHIDRDLVQFDFLTHRQERAAYDDEIESLGGIIYRLPRLVPWSRTYQHALDTFFKSHPEYRIVHVHQDCLSSVILKVAQRNGVPVRIAHSHSSAQDKNLKYPIKLYYRRLIPWFATDLFACGKDAGYWMFGGATFQVLNNAIDAASYRYDLQKASQMRQTLNIPQNALVIGHVGRFSPPKNHEFLVDIFAALDKKEQNVFLLLVGDGELRPKMEERVRSLGLADHVTFTGIRNDVPDLLQAMDVFVFPSHYEGLGIVAIEAQASGLPCVISDSIPNDCDLTDLVTRVSLTQSANTWAEKILTVSQSPRRDTYQTIADGGYTIAENARWLQNYYLEQWKATEYYANLDRIYPCL